MFFHVVFYNHEYFQELTKNSKKFYELKYFNSHRIHNIDFIINIMGEINKSSLEYIVIRNFS